MADFLLVADTETALRDALQQSGYVGENGQYITSSPAHSLNVLGVVSRPATFDSEGEELTPVVPYPGFVAMLRLVSGELPEPLAGLVADPAPYRNDIPSWGDGAGPVVPHLPVTTVPISFSSVAELRVLFSHLLPAQVLELETQGVIRRNIAATINAATTGRGYDSGRVSTRGVWLYGEGYSEENIVGLVEDWQSEELTPDDIYAVAVFLLQRKPSIAMRLIALNGGTMPDISPPAAVEVVTSITAPPEE